MRTSAPREQFARRGTSASRRARRAKARLAGEALRQRERGAALLGREVRVARRHASRRFADDRYSNYFDREVEIAHHAADDRELLVVLLAEHGDMRQRDVKLRTIVATPRSAGRLAPIAVLQLADLDEVCAPAGTSRPLGQNAKSIPHARAFARSRLVARILARSRSAELRGVDEDREREDVAFGARGAQQREVPSCNAPWSDDTSGDRAAQISARARMRGSRRSRTAGGRTARAQVIIRRLHRQARKVEV